MKALVWQGERAIALEELADPIPREDVVVLHVEVAGICGSDLHGYRCHPGPRVPPRVLAFADLVDRPAEVSKVLLRP